MRVLLSALLCTFSVSAYAEYSINQLQYDLEKGNPVMAYSYLGGALELAQTTVIALDVMKKPKPYCLPKKPELTVKDAITITQRSFRDELFGDKLGKHSAAGHFVVGLMTYYSCDENGKPTDLTRK
jgi:hypothetical protein